MVEEHWVPDTITAMSIIYDEVLVTFHYLYLLSEYTVNSTIRADSRYTDLTFAKTIFEMLLPFFCSYASLATSLKPNEIIFSDI